jgi:hypothetical protein
MLRHMIGIIMSYDSRQGLNLWMDLLTTYTHNSELRVITAPPLSSQFTNHHSTR